MKPIYNLTYLLSKHQKSQNNQTPSIMNDKQTIKKHWKEYGWKNCLGPDTDVHVLANQKNSSRTVDGLLSLEQTDYVTNWHQRHQFTLLRITGVILHAEISTGIRKRSLSVTTGATALSPLPPQPNINLILSSVDCCFVGLGEGRGGEGQGRSC